MRNPLIVIGVLLACGCSPEEPPQSGEPPPAVSESLPVQRADTVIQTQTGKDLFDVGVNPDSVDDRNRFIVLGLRRLGESYAELVANLGQPDSTKVDATENLHVPGQTDSIVTAYFKNVDATLYRVTGGKELIANITIYDNQYLLMPLVQVGMKWEDVLKVFGPPEFEDEHGYRWSCSACVVDQQVVVQVTDGEVKSVGFAYYMG